VRAIDSFSIELSEGGVYGLIGPNGAGKTTVFNIITGVYRPTSGSINYLGEDISGKKVFQVARLGIARTFQNIRLFANLSVLDNVMIACHQDAQYNVIDAIVRIGKFGKYESELTQKALDLLEIVGLKDKKDEIAGSLPYGHQRKLEIARAMAIKPRLLLLDEPAAGMNSNESADLVNFLKDIHKEFSLTVLLIEHHMDVVMGLCDRVTVMDFGRIIAEGTPKEIQTDKACIDAYLGGTKESC
jgi:branched-chain amino acid transport system ATP-binding protein